MRSLPALALLAGFGGAACQAPGGATPFGYGEERDCEVDAGSESNDEGGLISLRSSLDPLRDAFDRYSDMPRVVALIPHMGCERGAEILRTEVLDAFEGVDLRLFVIWQDVARTKDAARAAARATLHLADPRVVAFHDCEGRAGRAFARGKLPVAEAREVFLFYPAGATWPRAGAATVSSNGLAGALAPRSPRQTRSDATPNTDDWVHHLGRVSPERFCSPQELPREMRETVARLVAQAEARPSAGPR